MSQAPGVVVMCGPLAGLSGGDVHALRLVDAWHAASPGAVQLVAPPMMRPNLPPRSRGALRPIVTPLDRHVSGMGLYLVNVTIRMALVVLRAPRSDVDVAAAHLFHDVIPCAVRRLLRRNRAVVAYAYHLIEEERAPADLRSRVSIWLERLALALLRRTRALVFVDNEATERALRARGFRAQDLRSTGNAYDPWLELPPREPEPGTLVFVGRLTEEKGVWDALEVARRLPDARVVMLGDGPLRAEVEARAAQAGNVELLGFVSEEEKWHRLRRASAFLAPSREEGWGIAVGEALTAGLPVVAYDLPAYRHFGDRLRTVPTGDVEALAAAARVVLAEPAPASAAAGLPLWSDLLGPELTAIAERTA